MNEILLSVIEFVFLITGLCILLAGILPGNIKLYIKKYIENKLKIENNEKVEENKEG